MFQFVILDSFMPSHANLLFSNIGLFKLRRTISLIGSGCYSRMDHIKLKIGLANLIGCSGKYFLLTDGTSDELSLFVSNIFNELKETINNLHLIGINTVKDIFSDNEKVRQFYIFCKNFELNKNFLGQ